MLSWRYALAGDYDQNGEVNSADLLPLAKHLGESVPPDNADSIQAVVDGDGNGQITMADLTSIGRNFGQILHYEVRRSRNADDSPLDLSHGFPPRVVPTAAPLFATRSVNDLQGDPRMERLHLAVPLDGHQGDYYWVIALNSDNAPSTGATASYAGFGFQHHWAHWNLRYDAGQQKLTFFGSVPGDCSGDGRVSLLDTTDLGKSLGQADTFDLLSPAGSRAYRSDANQDGIVDLKDLAIIFLHLGQCADTFNVYCNTLAPADPFAPSALEPVGQTPWELDNFNPPSGSYVWIRPVYQGAEGPCSDALQIP
jgi:hypothetical protein